MSFLDSAQPPGLDPRSRDLLIRTVYGEAGNQPDEGKMAVASVIKNRVESGKYGDSVPAVITAPNQFEPWQRPEGRSRMLSLQPQDPNYQRIGAIVDGVFSGKAEDPTNGATHFFSPGSQAALGRQPPQWASNEPTAQIGGHVFFAPDGAKSQKVAQASTQDNPFLAPAAPQPSEDNPFLVAPTPLSERFAGGAERPAMRPAMQAAAKSATTGDPVPPLAGTAIDFMNQGPAAGQRTTPSIAAHAPNLISTEVQQSDSGDLLYKDPATGQVVPTDQNKHVILRDPADNTLKVYARTSNTDEGALSSAGRLLGTGMAVGAPTVRPGIASVEGIKPLASDIISTAKPYYTAFKDAAGKIDIPEGAAGYFADRVRGALQKANLIEDLAKPVYSAVDILENGEPMTMASLQNVKRVIGRSFKSPDKNVRDAAGVASGEIGKILADFTPEAAANLKTADAIHSTALSVQDLQRKAAVADLRAGRAGYGGNAVNSMRQVLSPIVEASVKGMRTGFTPEEITAMREIVEGNAATNAARLVGQFSPTSGLGILKSAAAVSGGAYAAGPAALAIPAIGAASNKLATFLTGNQIDALKELVAKRSPEYAAAVQKAVERFEKAQTSLASEPGPDKVAAFVATARSLTAGLNKDGISVTVPDFIRAIQGPVRAPAQDEQQ